MRRYDYDQRGGMRPMPPSHGWFPGAFWAGAPVYGWDPWGTGWGWPPYVAPAESGYARDYAPHRSARDRARYGTDYDAGYRRHPGSRRRHRYDSGW